MAARSEGVPDVVEAVAAHREWLESTGGLQRRRQARASAEIEAIALGLVARRFGDVRGSVALGVAAARVVAGATDPYSAADALVAAL